MSTITTARRLDGVVAAAEIKAGLRERVTALRARGILPGLATVLVGDDPASSWYVTGKHRDCGEVGVASIPRRLPADATQSDLDALIRDLNDHPACTGYIVQLPLPRGFDTQRTLEAMDPAKDADGLHPVNLGRLLLNSGGSFDSPLPCTPRGIIELVERNGFSFQGAEVVVVGRGVTVGRPIGPLLSRRGVDATVTLTHTGTRGLRDHLRRADIIIAAAGVPRLIDADDVKAGAIVLDVGVSRETDPVTGKGRVVGDLDPSVATVAAAVSPNPGGVGPMTRALLIANVVERAERAADGHPT